MKMDTQAVKTIFSIENILSRPDKRKSAEDQVNIDEKLENNSRDELKNFSERSNDEDDIASDDGNYEENCE